MLSLAQGRAFSNNFTTIMSHFQESDDREHRREPRYPCAPALCCRILDPFSGLFLMAGIRDLSISGISLLAYKQFRVGEQLTIELHRSSRDFTRKYLVEVRHSDIYCPNNSWLHGCQFVHRLSEEELQTLL